MNQPPRPPRLARRLLRAMAAYHERFAISGDLEEVFHEVGKEMGYGGARLWFWGQCLRSVPEYVVYLLRWNAVMTRNYLTTSCRNIARQKVHSVVNILGLSFALASCMLIYLYISDELSYDRFHDNADRIYGVMTRNEFHDESGLSTPIATGPLLETAFPEIRHTVRLNSRFGATVIYGDKLYNERPVFTDPEFFDVFTFPMIAGDPQTALLSGGSAVLTRSAALKYFGSSEPLGKTLTMNFSEKSLEFSVTGVCRDVPGNSTVRFDILLSVDDLGKLQGEEYLDNTRYFDTRTFVFLDEEASSRTVNDRLTSFVDQNYQQTLQRWRDQGGWRGEGNVFSFSLHGIKGLHFDPDYGSIGTRNARASAILAGIAALILVIASINFVNLSVGRAAGRTLEVGMRKVLGADRRQLVHQFLVESLLLVLLSLVVAGVFAHLLMPVFNSLAEKSLEFGSIVRTRNLAAMLILWLIVGLGAGAFPAVVMLEFRPVEIFSRKVKLGGKGLLTKSLVTVQFVLSVLLLVTAFTMGSQIRTMMDKELGFNGEGVLAVRLQENDWRSGRRTARLIELFESRLSGYPAVRNVSGTTATFQSFMVMDHVTVKGETHDVFINRVHYGYLETMGIRLAAGRDFSRDFPTDSTAVIVNRSFVERYGYEDPIGEVIHESHEPGVPLRIIGVVEDYHFQSVRHDVAPLILHMLPEMTIHNLLVRISLENARETIATIEEAWRELKPDKIFLHSFLDEDVESVYADQRRWNSVIRYSSILAVLISCMGVFALTSLNIGRRVREIGIRKVLGAGSIQIVNMIFREYLVLVAFANAIAWPLAYLLMRRWLEGYACRTSLGADIFLGAGALTLAVVLGTVSYLALRAALADPAVSLRTE